MTTQLTKANNARSKAHLNEVIRYCGRTMTRQTFLHDLKENGYTPDVAEVPKYEFNRAKYNRMNGWEQAAYEKKMKERKIEYRATKGSTVQPLTKMEYDYFITLF